MKVCHDYKSLVMQKIFILLVSLLSHSEIYPHSDYSVHLVYYDCYFHPRPHSFPLPYAIHSGTNCSLTLALGKSATL